MTKLGSFLKKVWDVVERIFGSIGKEMRKIIVTSHNVVENIKTFVDQPGVDVVTALIPGSLDDVIVDKLRIVLSNILAGLAGLRVEDGVSDVILSSTIKNINSMDDDAKKIFYHGLAVLITEKLSDGDLSWSDAIAIQEYYYKHEGKIIYNSYKKER